MNPLIAFEGIDGSGKATQVRMLAARFKKEGRAVTTFSFPEYKKPTGKLIKELLLNTYGEFRANDPFLLSLPYSVDRFLAKDRILAALKKGVVVSDRYTSSNLAFGGAHCPPERRREFRKFFEQLEYKDFGMPHADMTVYLAPSVELTQKWLRSERKKLDANERDADFQKQVVAIYSQLSKEKGWVVIPCSEGDSAAVIHERVWKTIQKR